MSGRESQSPGPRELARRLLAEDSAAGARGHATSERASRDQALAARAACGRLYARLTPWFGVDGCDALFARGLAEAQARHPALAGVRVGPQSTGLIEGVDESVAAHGPEDVAAGLESLVITLLEVLSRMIGADLAAHILSHPEAAQHRDDEESTR